MPIEILALIFSGIALVLSFLLAAWDIVKYYRDGGRVRIVLEAGRFEKNQISYTTKTPPFIDPLPQGFRFEIEVARITIENRGRTPVTVSSIVFDLGRTKLWPFSGRHTVGFSYVPFDDYEKSFKVRLEPYDAASFMMDASHALPVVVRSRKKPLRVRASAHVAGVGTVRSSWRRGWKMDPHEPPRLWMSEPYDLAKFIYQFLAWHFAGDNSGLTGISLGDACMDIAQKIEAGGSITQHEIEAILTGKIRDIAPSLAPSSIMAAFDLSEEFEKGDSRLFSKQYYKTMRLARGATVQIPPSSGS